MDLSKGVGEIIRRTPLLTAEQERALIEKTRQGDLQAREQLVLANLRWVWKVALNYRGRGVPFDDLFQLGILGLIRAIDGFDLTHTVRLTTYATFRIREYMLQDIETRGTVIRVPTKRKIKTLPKEEDRVSAENILQGSVSLDAVRRGKGGANEWNLKSGAGNSQLLHGREDVMHDVGSHETHEFVHKMLEKLPDLDRQVLEMRMQEMSLAAISKVFLKSTEWARKTEKRARQRLRALLEAVNYEP